jgi:hypothetical protein
MGGEIPPYYTEADIQTDPRDLFFNLGTENLVLSTNENAWECSLLRVLIVYFKTSKSEIAQMLADNNETHSNWPVIQHQPQSVALCP